ncbi:hypothetical protein MSAN_01370800 [Mycena sanguinolenta]|uniref:Uncharacterized protein n=1 Tax=Mycena sanguinolenta TaxID=230812 RepID=A0A8H6Y9Y6_9AGAR|nr:hypothetical protein MSAN_01370800 [Mycena sanguinolenta]
MANFATALLGTFSRMIFPPTALPSSQSDLDFTAERAAACTCIRPASSTSERPRPRSAFDGYWRWEESSGMILLDRASQDPGLKGLADTKITRSSPVLVCQPPRTDASSTTSEEFNSVNLLESLDTTVPIPDSSFDISLISDTSTENAEDSFECDTSFTLPPLPVAPANLGLGLSGLFKADGSPFDGMGVVSFGCDTEGHGGSPRGHQTQHRRTVACVPRGSSVDEDEEQELVEENLEHVKPCTPSHKSKTNVTRPLALPP